MRVSKQTMRENNARIIEKAAQLYREKGVDATSVADVMEAAGLTHGGFYRHFNSKDELVSAALQKAFEDTSTSLRENLTKEQNTSAIIEFAKQYLSVQHVNNIAQGCPLVALAAEVDRKNTLSGVMSQGANALTRLLAEGLQGNNHQRHAKATSLLAILIGSVTLARSSETKTEMNNVLTSSLSLVEKLIVE